VVITVFASHKRQELRLLAFFRRAFADPLLASAAKVLLARL
jgi:hypothetical protein